VRHLGVINDDEQQKYHSEADDTSINQLAHDKRTLDSQHKQTSPTDITQQGTSGWPGTTTLDV